MRDSSSALLLALLASGCLITPSAEAPPHLGARPHEVAGVRILRTEEARRLKLRSLPFELRFGDGQDGTKLIVDFLAQAKRAGARYASDLYVILRTRRDGQAVACQTWFLQKAQERTTQIAQVVPGRTEVRSVMRPVTQSVTEYSYQCQTTSVPVTRMETTYQYQYDYASKSSRSVPVTRSVTSYESRQDCRMVPTTRVVTRYEYQLETHYVPPSLTYISARYTDFELVESRPVCVLAEETDERAPHVIHGTIWRDPW